MPGYRSASTLTAEAAVANTEMARSAAMGIEVVPQPRHQLPLRARVGQQRQPAARAQRGEVERVEQARRGQHGAEHRLPRGAAPRAEHWPWRRGLGVQPRPASERSRPWRASSCPAPSEPDSSSARRMAWRARDRCSLVAEPVQVAPDPGGERGLRRPVEQFLGRPVGHADPLVVGVAGRSVMHRNAPDELLDGLGYFADGHRRATFQRQDLSRRRRGQRTHVRVGQVLHVHVVALLLTGARDGDGLSSPAPPGRTGRRPVPRASAARTGCRSAGW